MQKNSGLRAIPKADGSAGFSLEKTNRDLINVQRQVSIDLLTDRCLVSEGSGGGTRLSSRWEGVSRSEAEPSLCAAEAVLVPESGSDPIGSVWVCTSGGGSWSFFQDASEPFRLRKRRRKQRIKERSRRLQHTWLNIITLFAAKVLI